MTRTHARARKGSSPLAGGPRGLVVFLAAFNVVATARSLIQMPAPDCGAQSIASMNTRVAGGRNIVGLLGQWDGGQLLESLLIWTVPGDTRAWSR